MTADKLPLSIDRARECGCCRICGNSLIKSNPEQGGEFDEVEQAHDCCLARERAGEQENPLSAQLRRETEKDQADFRAAMEQEPATNMAGPLVHRTGQPAPAESGETMFGQWCIYGSNPPITCDDPARLATAVAAWSAAYAAGFSRGTAELAQAKGQLFDALHALSAAKADLAYERKEVSDLGEIVGTRGKEIKQLRQQLAEAEKRERSSRALPSPRAP